MKRIINNTDLIFDDDNEIIGIEYLTIKIDDCGFIYAGMIDSVDTGFLELASLIKENGFKQVSDEIYKVKYKKK